MAVIFNKQIVFYIVAPPYTTQSAGIRVLHLLCHLINTHGGSAFILYEPKVLPKAANKYLNSKLSTTLLSTFDLKKHKRLSLKIIVIYPEIIWGNPYHSSRVARYLLNFPGLLKGPSYYKMTDFVFSYSESINNSYPESQGQLFIPTLNTENFWFTGNEKREFTCYYAAKHKSLGGQPIGLPEGCVEITRGKGSLSQQQVGDLLRRSKCIYIFENTHLIYEAVMCGCPVVIKFNEHFKELIGNEHFSLNGITFSDSEKDLRIAYEKIPEALKGYQQLEEITLSQLKVFSQKIERFKFEDDKTSFYHPFYSPIRLFYVGFYILPINIWIKAVRFVKKIFQL